MIPILMLVAVASALGGLVSLGIAVGAWRNRDTPAAPAFGWLMVAVSGWCFFAAAFVFADDPGTAYLIDRLISITATQVPPLLLVFVLAYAGRDRWLTPKWLGLLWFYPTVYALLLITSPWHGLTTGPGSVEMVTVYGITAPYVPPSPVEAVVLSLSYLVAFVSFVVLFTFLARSRTTYRSQAFIVTIGTLVPVIANASFQLGLTFHPGIDPTPMTLTLTGLVVGWGLFRYDFLKETPVATDILVDELPDPVLVIDEEDRVVDHNPAAREIFAVSSLSEAHVDDVAPSLLRHLSHDEVYSLTDHSTDGGTLRSYDPQVTTIEDQHGIERGRLVVLRDITGQQRRQDRLEALQTATQQFITATTDEQIAQFTVTFIERALDGYAAGLFLVDETESVLRPAALTDSALEFYDKTDLYLGPDSSVFDVYEHGERTVLEPDEDTPFSQYALFPLGEHGVLAIGFEDDDFATADEQFAAILARTTQVALTQVERESELRQSRQSVERRNQQMEFFDGILRHTLRNALLVIRGRAEYLRESVDDEHEQHLHRIVHWCEDIAALNEEIREINDTVTATEDRQFDVIELSPLIRNRVNALVADYEDIDVALDVEDGLFVHANDLAGRVIDSVVSNAITHNDSDEPRIEVTTMRVAHRIQVRVADNGPGMSDEMKETFFERDLAANVTSRGFGVYFVSVLMDLYGGTVWFEDNEPRGTVAVLEFQAADDQHHESQGTSPLA